MLRRSTPYIFAGLLLLLPFRQHQGSNTPRLFETFGDIGCEMIDLHMSEYAQTILTESSAQAHVLCYSGFTDSPGKILRYMNYIQANLSDYLEKDSRVVSVKKAGTRKSLSIELWIVPVGAIAPTPTDSKNEIEVGTLSPQKYDETEASIMEYNKRSYLSFGSLCTLTFPEWGEYFRILRDDRNLKGHIIIYVGVNDGARQADRIERFLRNELKKDYSDEVRLLTMVYGGKREWSQIEIWLVPKGMPSPEPTPRTKNSR